MATERQNRKIITSFMLRFVYEEEAGSELSPTPVPIPGDGTPEDESNPGWRGVVKHIQSGAEHHFTSFAEAEAFIKKYVKG